MDIMLGTYDSHTRTEITAAVERACTMMLQWDSPSWLRTGQTARAPSAGLPPWVTRLIFSPRSGFGEVPEPLQCTLFPCECRGAQRNAARAQKNEHPRVSIKMDSYTGSFTFFTVLLYYCCTACIVLLLSTRHQVYTVSPYHHTHTRSGDARPGTYKC